MIILMEIPITQSSDVMARAWVVPNSKEGVNKNVVVISKQNQKTDTLHFPAGSVLIAHSTL